MDYSILLTTDGKGIEAKREALNHLLSHVAELEAEVARLKAPSVSWDDDPVIGPIIHDLK